MKFIRTLKASDNELFQIGWSLEFAWEDDNETYYPYFEIQNKNIDSLIDKIEGWFLKEGYKEYFTSIRAEAHDDYGVYGSAWVTQSQLEELNEEGWMTSAGTFDLPDNLQAQEGFLYVHLQPFDFESPITIEGR